MDMEFDWWNPLLMSTLAGLSTTIGGLVVFMFKERPGPKQMAFVYALAAGVMVTVTLIELWFPALMGKNTFSTIVASACGGLVYYGFSKLMPEVHDMEQVDLPSHTDIEQSPKSARGETLSLHENGSKDRRWRLACLMMCVLTMHNFPEGLAVAASAVHGERLGWIMMIAIGMHNIPEGIAIAVPTYDSTGSRWQALGMAFLSGLTEPLGAVFALTILHHFMSEHVIETLLCFVGGMMFSVAVFELLPEARHYRKTGALITGFMVGVIVMGITCLAV